MSYELLKANAIRAGLLLGAVAVLVLLYVLALRMSGRNARPFALTCRLLGRIARYSAVPPILVFLIALGNGLLVTLIAGRPLARVHDEFSYLLGGDTFALGRMTNPRHPMWVHFETMHEVFEPTYASKFQPLQGVTLALGQVLSDGPWVGALLTNALACAVMTWALRAWIRPRWALLAGLLVSVHPQLVEWGHGYWGGQVGMVGGSLVFGGVGRILRGRRKLVLWSIVLAVGGTIVAGIRPWEGAVWGVLAGLTLLIWSLRRNRQTILRVAIPIVCMLIPGAVLQGYYNWRVTGSVTTLPYVLHARKYMSVPVMLWQPIPDKKDYSKNPQMDEQYNQFEYEFYMNERGSLKGYLQQSAIKFYGFLRAHIIRDLPLLLGLLAFPFAIGKGRMIWIAMAYAAVILTSYAITPFFIAHYLGAHMPVMFMLAMRGLQWISVRKLNDRAIGRAFVGLCFLTCIPVLIYTHYTEHRDNTRGYAVERHKIELQLKQDASADDLVFVHYDPGHNFHNEWVFNGADIDNQKVIWAREMSPAENDELVKYYPNRRTWVVQADQNPPKLEPFAAKPSQ